MSPREMGNDTPALTDQLFVSLRPAHEWLDQHFQELRHERDEFGSHKPIFALEHGLGQSEIDALSETVRKSLLDEGLTRHWWLPWVIYAVEIGYRYTGDEFWPTFEQLTPGWAVRGDRHYIRRKFQEFAARFGGAQPTGAWAEQFSIICWPITHAVLPKDLQLSLASLLYEYRHHLSPDLLANPDELGIRLASRAWDSSARFRIFAQNTALLGQVAAALLLGDESKSSLLLRSTLVRVVRDLSHERQARRWLNDAKASATSVHVRGLAPTSPGARASGGARRSEESTLRVGSPSLLLLASKSGWELFLEMPDVTPLAARSPELRDALANSRCVVAGASAPLARGQLLYPGKRVRLEAWPGTSGPLLQLEPSRRNVDEILADECRLSTGPTWLFTVSEESATEVKSKVVHPGTHYVLLMQKALPFDLPPWIARAELGCVGVWAYEIETPSPLGATEIARFEALGLAAVTEISVRPVGLVPAAWDGEGSIEWVEGDEAVVAVTSTLEIDRFAMALDSEPLTEVKWSPDKTTFISLDDLELGPHRLDVVLRPTDGGRIVQGRLDIAVRSRRLPVATGTYRDPLVILANPALPGLGALWEGKAALEILGPADTSVAVTVTLERGDHTPAFTREIPGLSLPVDRGDWLRSFDLHVRQPLERYYDEATACVVVAANPQLGTTSLRCEREFAALRWKVGQDHDGPFVRLHDNLGEPNVLIERFEFATPDKPLRVAAQQNERLRTESGGLFLAQVGKFSASVVLPARVRNFADLGRAKVQVQLSVYQRSTDGVMKLARLSHLWSSASLPGSPMAAIPRDLVLQAIADEVAETLLGQQWSATERRIREGGIEKFPMLALAFPKPLSPPQVPLWMTVERNAKVAAKLSLERRAALLQGSLLELAPHVGNADTLASVAEGLLRLASDPGAIVEWAQDGGQRTCAVALGFPIAFAAARAFVLGTQLSAPQVAWSSSTAGGWDWE